MGRAAMMVIKLILIVALSIAITLAGCYLAGAAYFVLSKSIPTDLAYGTWLRYWLAYRSNPVQRTRLLLAAAFAAGTVASAAVLLIVAAFKGKSASLHGDARWATTAEIRKAGLL
jgi:type IV secretion system protein VirD4